MESVLLQLGLSDKEVSLYLLLLKKPHQSAQELANQTDIKRTNVYRLLDNLQSQGLITSDKSPVKKFTTTEPQALQKVLQEKQSQLKQTANSLSVVMPALRSQYALSLDKPGVVHMTGEDGLERLLLDMVNSKTEVLLVAGDEPTDERTRERFRELIMKRKENHVHTRAIFHNGSHRTRIQQKFTERGFDVRFLGTLPFSSEIILYEDNVVFSVYDPSLINTVITNQQFAATMRTLFEELWQTAK